MPVSAVATHFYEGKALKLAIAFTDGNGAPADPTTVTLRYTPPGQTTTQHVYGVDGVLIKASTGNYYEVVSTRGKSGEWAYDYYGTGALEAADGGVFYVDKKYA
jgi:hypothetical protein